MMMTSCCCCCLASSRTYSGRVQNVVTRSLYLARGGRLRILRLAMFSLVGWPTLDAAFACGSILMYGWRWP